MLSRQNILMEAFYVYEKEREMYLAACRYESDRVSMINESEWKGIMKGCAQVSYQKALETARLMKFEKLSIDRISKVTGLSIAAIEKL